MSAGQVSLPYAREQLQNWLDALEACSTGGSYSIAGRQLTRQDVGTIRGEITGWHRTVTALEQMAAGTCRPLGAVASFPAPGSGRSGGGIIPASEWDT